jgi:hypothetical protein
MLQLGDVVAAGEDPDQSPVILHRLANGREQVQVECAFTDLNVELFELVECENQPAVIGL